MATYQTPGIRWVNEYPAPPSELRTGTPAFLGYAPSGSLDSPAALTEWAQFPARFGSAMPGCLADAVRSFFKNGGELCYVVRLDPALDAAQALARGLGEIEALTDVDLVCAPDIVGLNLAAGPAQVTALQQQVLDACAASGTRFAILDALPAADIEMALAQRQALDGLNGALYYPWIAIRDEAATGTRLAPPCGPVAGVFARTDRQTGVHKAPANEVLEGVLDLETRLTDADQARLNPAGVNCLRAFPGRGIRVWGARTLSADPAWRYVNVRRLFLTAGRWIEAMLPQIVWEPHDPALWARVTRSLTAYFSDLHRRGALAGGTPQEAFYVKCDAETNPPETRDAGMVVTEIGLAPVVPGEFIVVRVIHRTGGLTLSQPGAAGTGTAAVRIAHIVYDPAGEDLPGEVVLLRNRGDAGQELAGWSLSDLAGNRFIFPALRLAPGETVRVWTGRGANTATDLFWGRAGAVWTNIGDRARLHNAAGVLVDEYVYHPLDDLLAARAGAGRANAVAQPANR